MLRRIIVPNCLADIKLKDYQRFIGANPTEETGDQLALSIFCGIDADEYHMFPKADLDDIKSLLTFALSEKPPLQQTIEMDGVEYGFHPDLDNISLGEFIDCQEYMREPIKNATKWLGVLYRPIIKKGAGRYEIAKYDPIIHDGKAFEETSMDIVEGCLTFFTRLQLALQMSSVMSLKGKETPGESKRSSESDGDGLQLSINSLKAMYYMLKPSRVRH